MVEIFEGDRASNYEMFVDAWIPNYREFIDSVPKLLSGVRERNLLVAGCGTGNEILALGDQLSQWKVTGVDPSPEMLSQAREKLEDMDNVTLLGGQVRDLHMTEQFGAATLLLVLHFLKDDGSKLYLLAEIAKRMEVAAPFVMLDITGSTWQIKRNLEVLRNLVSNYIPPEEIQGRIERIEGELHYVTEERLTELFMQAGFERPVRFYQNTIYMGWYSRKV
ncbi:class I SAM-dependent methyltransferase [Marinoscillum pacificum]|uniref:class I SAM-dependent methyltransferase n=1 Tax=Marinoscillum pacificum TaxID=392723 RepID=UPI0021570F8C|nr:class I SAM-dependent methyltransferase [Marinoscillum pacificum]